MKVAAAVDAAKSSTAFEHETNQNEFERILPGGGIRFFIRRIRSLFAFLEMKEPQRKGVCPMRCGCVAES